MKKKIIQIDFDGVLHKASHGYGDGTIYDVPNENAMFTVKNWIEAGYRVVILTARDKKEFPRIVEWLEKWDFPEMKITNRKLSALAYIDNRAIRFTSFADIYSYFI